MARTSSWVHGIAVECEHTVQAIPNPILSPRGLGQIEPGARTFLIEVADAGDLNWFSVAVPNPACIGDESLYLDTLYLSMRLDDYIYLVEAQIYRGNVQIWRRSFRQLPEFLGLAGSLEIPVVQGPFSNVNSLAYVVEREPALESTYSRLEADLHAGLQVRMALTSYREPPGPHPPELAAHFLGVGIDFTNVQETTEEFISTAVVASLEQL